MRLLILGGTGWLGHATATAALERGIDVSCLARGESGPVPDGAVLVRRDRDDPTATDSAADSTWDAVVDLTSQPGRALRAARALSSQAAHAVYVSSGSVYADTSLPGADESAPLLPALDGEVMESLETYGEAKVACEQHVLTAFGPERAAIVRAGLIGGPGDVSDRSGYWPWRFAHPADDAGRVLVPSSPGASVQVVDVRDLARWLVDLATERIAGVFNATGDAVELRDHLEAARRVAGHAGGLVEADQEWLEAREVAPWMGPRSLPLWLPMPDYAGFGSRDNAAARAAGLVSRPLDQTLADTLRWEESLSQPRQRRAGLSDADERDLVVAAAG